ncbi:MAG: IS21 family transposase [Lachnospiraceae bacterium]|nr:IS21 family transposase [Lachnospiraceae bacterium]
MTKYREILRLSSLSLSQEKIALSCGSSKKTVNKVLKAAKDKNILWPLEPNMTDDILEHLLFPKDGSNSIHSNKRMPDYDYIHKELLRNGVNKKLLWTEYLEDCKRAGDDPLMYSQFCYYIQQDEQKRRATMHINRKPGEQVEVDWAGDPAHIIDPDTGEIINAWLFVGVMTYSMYPYVEAFVDEKQHSWITAHVHMYEYFGGVARILVPDNCRTAVDHNKGWKDQRINAVYQEMAEHYGTAVIPARVRAPKDKPNAEGSVGNISTWITAALRNEQFFSFEELNRAIRQKLEEFSHRPFQKKEGSRYDIFHEEELPLLAPLPAYPYELAEWKQATVQFNYHISCAGMLYSVPYEYIKRKVDVRVTDKMVEIFYNNNRIASHRRLYGRKGQYSTVTEHMPPSHQQYLEWNGDRFRKWAERIGENTYQVVDAILTSKRVEQQSYRSCMGLLKLADKYSVNRLEAACRKALSFTPSPSYKSIKNILDTGSDRAEPDDNGNEATTKTTSTRNSHALTRGADYYRR